MPSANPKRAMIVLEHCTLGSRHVASLTVKQLDSLVELRDVARAWDELWERSEISLPTARADRRIFSRRMCG